MPKGDGTGPTGGGSGTGRGAGQGGGRGRMGGNAMGTGGNCKCPACGKIISWNLGCLPPAAGIQFKKWYAQVENSDISFWEEIRESALAAHERFRDVYAIAWDYVITPDGPFLLEGNTGWGTRTVQLFHGGLLK